MIDLFRQLSERIKENRPSILITITRTRGATPGKTGFKILIGEEGRITGTIGGGAVEFHAIDKCKELIKSDSTYYNEIIICGITFNKFFTLIYGVKLNSPAPYSTCYSAFFTY